MLTIYICVGSSCYLKGSNEIIALYLQLINNLSIEARVQIKGAFCLENCSSGVTVMIDEEIIAGVTKENCEQIFNEKVLGKLKKYDCN